MVQAEQWRWW